MERPPRLQARKVLLFHNVISVVHVQSNTIIFLAQLKVHQNTPRIMIDLVSNEHK